MVTQYDIELYLRLEHEVIHKKLELYPGISEDQVMQFMERVSEAQVLAKRQMKELDEKKKGGRKRGGAGSDEDDAKDTEGVVGGYKQTKKKKFSGGKGGGGKIFKKRTK